jgi:hypothetical protein
MDKGGVFGDGACCHHIKCSNNKNTIPMQSPISISVLVSHLRPRISVFSKILSEQFNPEGTLNFQRYRSSLLSRATPSYIENSNFKNADHNREYFCYDCLYFIIGDHSTVVMFAGS